MDINGSPDIKANATAKATVAIFSASEGHSHPRVVTLPKTEEGLGFNIMGGSEQSSPIYISRIISGGVADRIGSLKRGDQLLSVNGVSVEGESHDKAVELLKASKDKVVMVVRYTPRVLEEIETRFEKSRQQKVFKKWESNVISIKIVIRSRYWLQVWYSIVINPSVVSVISNYTLFWYFSICKFAFN